MEPKNIKDLYDGLLSTGYLTEAVSFERFKAKWDEEGGKAQVHKQLLNKGLTKMPYGVFVSAWGNDVPSEDHSAIVELDPTVPGKSTEEPMSSLGDSKDKEDGAGKSEVISSGSPELTRLQGLYDKQIAGLATKEELAQANAYVEQVDKQPIGASKETLNKLVYGPDSVDGDRATMSAKELSMADTYAEKILNDKTIKQAPKTIGDRAAGAFLINMPLGLESAWEGTKAMSVDWLGKVDAGAADWLVGKEYLDGEGNPVMGKGTDEYVVDQLKKIKELDSSVQEVGGMIKGIQEGDFDEFAGGFFNAIQGVVSTVAPAILTRGASLTPQIIAPTWVDYNTTKAEAKYGAVYDAEGNMVGGSQDPIAAMVEAEDTEWFVPVTIGVGMLALEKAGFKGMGKYLAGKRFNTAALNNFGWALTNSKEAGTEWVQGGLETINTELAQGKDLTVAAKAGLDMMTSRDGFEQALAGFAGSGVLTGKRAVSSAVSRALRSDEQGKIVVEGIDAINSLRQKRAETKSKAVRDAYDVEIAGIEKGMKEYLRENYKLIKHLSPEETKSLENTLSKKDKIERDIQQLKDDLTAGKITTKEFGYAKRELNNKNKQLSQKIADIKESVDKSRTFSDIENLQKLSETLEDTDVTVVDNVDSAMAEGKAKEWFDAYWDDLQSKRKTKLSAKRKAAEWKTFKESPGAMYKDGAGVKKIYVHANNAALNSRTSTGQHEFLHGIFKGVLDANPKLAEQMNDALQVSLQKAAAEGKIFGRTVIVKDQDGNDIEISAYDKRAYISKDQSAAVQAEERLTVLAEMLGSGEVGFNETSKGLLGDITEIVRRTFLDLGIKKHNVTGEGVLQFIKDYNREYQRGKLSKATQRFMEEGQRIQQAAKEQVNNAVDNDQEADSGIRHSRKNKDIYVRQVVKNRKDLDADEADQQVEEIFTLIDANSGKGEAIPANKAKKFENVMLSWVKRGTTKLPEDNGQVLEAIVLGQRYNVNFQEFKSPSELLEAYRKRTEAKKKTDPGTLPGLANKRALAEGYYSYDIVDEMENIAWEGDMDYAMNTMDMSREEAEVFAATNGAEVDDYASDFAPPTPSGVTTREAMASVRQIADEHFGPTFNNWCLIWRSPKDKSPNDFLDNENTKQNWRNYGPGKKIIFNKEGKLVAFSTVEEGQKRQYWDFLDKSSDGVPLNVKVGPKAKMRGEMTWSPDLRYIGEINPESGARTLSYFMKGSDAAGSKKGYIQYDKKGRITRRAEKVDSKGKPQGEIFLSEEIFRGDDTTTREMQVDKGGIVSASENTEDLNGLTHFSVEPAVSKNKHGINALMDRAVMRVNYSLDGSSGVGYFLGIFDTAYRPIFNSNKDLVLKGSITASAVAKNPGVTKALAEDVVNPGLNTDINISLQNVDISEGVVPDGNYNIKVSGTIDPMGVKHGQAQNTPAFASTSPLVYTYENTATGKKTTTMSRPHILLAGALQEMGRPHLSSSGKEIINWAPAEPRVVRNIAVSKAYEAMVDVAEAVQGSLKGNSSEDLKAGWDTQYEHALHNKKVVKGTSTTEFGTDTEFVEHPDLKGDVVGSFKAPLVKVDINQITDLQSAINILKADSIIDDADSLRFSKKDLYEQTEDFYKEMGAEAGGFMIADLWRNYVASLVNKTAPKNGGGKTWGQIVNDSKVITTDDFVNNLILGFVGPEGSTKIGSQTVYGLVQSFKPGTKLVKEGESGDQSLPGWINYSIKKYIPYWAAKTGVVGEENQVFQANVDDLKGGGPVADNITAAETAERAEVETSTKTDDRKTDRKTLLQGTNLGEQQALMDEIQNRMILNISSNMTLFNKARTKNTTQDEFASAIFKGMYDDAQMQSNMTAYIMGTNNPAQTIINLKTAFLANAPKPIIGLNKTWNRIIQQKSTKGTWLTRQQTKFGTYDYIKPDGSLYKARDPEFARNAGNGHTAGKYIRRKHPNFPKLITDEDFLNSFKSKSGKIDKKKVASMSRIMYAQLGVEMLQNQLMDGEGPLVDILRGRLELKENMTEEQKKEALELGLVIRENVTNTLTDETTRAILTDLERDQILYSKADKAGFSWFDQPRIDMQNFLGSLETNEVRQSVVQGTTKSEKYDILREKLTAAFGRYTDHVLYKNEWSDIQKDYHDKFSEKNYHTVEDFINGTLERVNNTLPSLLRLPQDALLFGKENSRAKEFTKRGGVDAYIADFVGNAKDKEMAMKFAIKTLVGATAGSANQELYLNTPGFYNEVVLPGMILNGIDLDAFQLVDNKTGSTIVHRGKKITSEFGRGVYSPDIAETMDDVAEGNAVISSIDLDGRNVEAVQARAMFKHYVDWMVANKETLTPVTIGMMLKAFEGKNRSVASLMHPVSHVMFQDGVNELADYTTLRTIPAAYTSRVVLDHILNGGKETEIARIMYEGFQIVMPTKIAEVIDRVNFGSSDNLLDSKEVNEALEREGLPLVRITSLKQQDLIQRVGDPGLLYSKADGDNTIELTPEQKGTRAKFNVLVQQATGYKTVVPKAIAAQRGKVKDTGISNTFKLVSASAEDFMGLMYYTLGKGKSGELQKEFIRNKLLKPYLRGIKELDALRQEVSKAFKTVNKQHSEVVDRLYKYVPTETEDNYTLDKSIRFFLYNAAGYGDLVEGFQQKVDVSLNGKQFKMEPSVLTKPTAQAMIANGLEILTTTPEGTMLSAVLNDADALEYALALSSATRLKAEGANIPYLKPAKTWYKDGNIASEFHSLVGKEYRTKAMTEFNDNVELMFSEDNLNKLEAKFGTNYRKALFNVSPTAPGIIQRMSTGKAGRSKADGIVNWINGSIAPIMFLNRRSALLQMLSATNYVNWTDNNPVAAAKAAGNTKQYLDDIIMILKSDKMRERRSGLKYSVEEAQLANDGTKGFEAIREFMQSRDADKLISAGVGAFEVFQAAAIKVGFSLTQAADSFAIAAGGATFYRNRIETYKKQGMEQSEAENTAWMDFSEQTDLAQQSSDQSLLSADQTRGYGRLILAFANTPAQYTRIMLKSYKDLRNGRGSAKEHISKIVYYGAMQNLLFSMLQNSLFATWDWFAGDEEEEEFVEKEAYLTAKYKALQSKDYKNRYTPAEATAKAKKEVNKLREERAKWSQMKTDRIVAGGYDNILRGAGIKGAILSAVIKVVTTWNNEVEKESQGGFGKVALTLGSVSPPMGKKMRELNNVFYSQKYNEELRDHLGWTIDNPRLDEALAMTEVITNLPGTWFTKTADAGDAMFTDAYGANAMQRLAIGGGWSPRDMGLKSTEYDQLIANVKAQESWEKTQKKAAEKQALKEAEQLRIANRTPEEIARDTAEEKRKKREASKKRKETRRRNKEEKLRKTQSERAQNGLRNKSRNKRALDEWIAKNKKS